MGGLRIDERETVEIKRSTLELRQRAGRRGVECSEAAEIKRVRAALPRHEIIVQRRQGAGGVEIHSLEAIEMQQLALESREGAGGSGGKRAQPIQPQHRGLHSGQRCGGLDVEVLEPVEVEGRAGGAREHFGGRGIQAREAVECENPLVGLQLLGGVGGQHGEAGELAGPRGQRPGSVPAQPVIVGKLGRGGGPSQNPRDVRVEGSQPFEL